MPRSAVHKGNAIPASVKHFMRLSNNRCLHGGPEETAAGNLSAMTNCHQQVVKNIAENS